MIEPNPEWEKLLQQQLIKSLIPRMFQGGWDGYDTTRPEHSRLKIEAIRWVETFSIRKSTGLRLGGKVGSGKTRLGYAILEALIRRGVYRVAAIDSLNFFQEIRESFDSPRFSAQDVFNGLLDNDVLFYDDLGSESGRSRETTDFVLESLYTLFNRALQAGRPVLILSSNYDMTGLRKILGPGNGERITSRLREMTEVLGQFPKIDMRKSQKARNRGETNAEKSRLAAPEPSLAPISGGPDARI